MENEKCKCGLPAIRTCDACGNPLCGACSRLTDGLWHCRDACAGDDDAGEHENENELANRGLWGMLDACETYMPNHPRVTQQIMNTIGDAIDRIGIQPVERCDYCDNVAFGVCDTCGASLCIRHMHVVNNARTYCNA